MSDTDRIQKKIVLRAPVERVWNALSDSKQFGSWFGVRFDSPFVAGKPMVGKMTPTTVDPAVAQMQEPYTGMRFEFTVDRIEPMRFFSFRWHPFAVEPDFDYSSEPMTLVTFELEEVPEGTSLTITESGFDSIPVARRAQAFKSNEGGWTHQLQLIEKYVTS
jgi:uncharacterized protein YndB with AHSA1/START domain